MNEDVGSYFSVFSIIVLFHNLYEVIAHLNATLNLKYSHFLSCLFSLLFFWTSHLIQGSNFKTLLKGSDNPGPTYWEGKAPPSSVLGVGEKIPSGLFGPLSLVALVAGTACVHESNIFNQLSSTTVNPQYIVGSLLVPISWGMHVAAWIQKQNGK